MKKFFLIFAIVCIIISCNSNNSNENTKSTDSTYEPKLGTLYDAKLNDSTVVNIADSMIYDVVIKNTDSSDEWQKSWLQGLDRRSLVDLVFKAVYAGNAKAYDYADNHLLTIDEVKAIEKKQGFDRKKVGKVQFIEDWQFDPKNMRFNKRVKALMLGWELYDNEGNVKSYSATFVVPMNN